MNETANRLHAERVLRPVDAPDARRVEGVSLDEKEFEELMKG